MPDSDDEEQFTILGTLLEPYEEGDIPKKKPTNVQDQIATDKHGRRRFHGAFTGGFTAGHFNTVGTSEGWKPSSFKSSRSSKFDNKSQQPEDFMDEEDLDDFGIAPSVLRAKSEYSGSKGSKKRERVSFQDGPIPGEPVLRSILEPAKDSVGVLLLMKMGWKPGQGIGPRLSKLEKRLHKNKVKLQLMNKVYGCSQKPPSSSDESEESDQELDPNILFAPDDVEVAFSKPKVDLFGMGYSGLDRSLIFSNNPPATSVKKQDTFRMLDNNRKLAIKGQAFGVGAFEEEDADIYARDDMSQYDFALETPTSLKEKRRLEKLNKDKGLAITEGSSVIEGFVPAKKPPGKKKYFPPPTLPPGFEPRHKVRQSRFGPELSDLPELKGKKHQLDAEDRSVILGEKLYVRPPDKIKDEEKQAPETSMIDLDLPDDPKGDMNFKPFVADPPKQARYEKFLQLIKIGAKDALKSLQPKNMVEWEKEREKTEFEQAAKLYRPLSGLMADRFARAELPDESLDPLAPVARSFHGVPPDMLAAAKAKMFGKLTRTVDDWIPVSLVCKRMNIAEPANSGGKSLCDVAKEQNKKKSRFSVFDILVNSDDPFKNFKEEPASNQISNLGNKDDQSKKEESGTKPNTLEPPDTKTAESQQFDSPADKADLFKAIFCDSEEDEEEKETEQPVETVKLVEPNQLNLLHNTSPPRGIFANLNLDELNKKPSLDEKEIESRIKVTPSTKPFEENDKSNTDDVIANMYGPALPSRPVFISKHKSSHKKSHIRGNSSSSSDSDRWIEKGSSESLKKGLTGTKHKKKKKKHKKRDHKDKRKRKDKKR